MRLLVCAILMLPTFLHAETLYVSPSGENSGSCTDSANPCQTLTYSISQMQGGDTLIVGNGVYTDTIRYVPSGNSGPDGIPRTADDIYTTVQAETDLGVLIDGTSWNTNGWVYGIRLDGLEFIKIRGIRVNGGSHETGGALTVQNSNHIKIMKCGFWGAPVNQNASTVGIGPKNDYVLVEESYAFGGARYQFLNYWSRNSIFRRNVARNDYFNYSLQSAAFTNYDSQDTVWQNNIAIDSDDSCCYSPGLHLYAAFFNENKPYTSDPYEAVDTSQTFSGNIVLNYDTFYGAHLDWVVSGTRQVNDHIIWGGPGGYWGEQGPGTTASFSMNNLTIGATTGSYNPGNGGDMRGVGVNIAGDLVNSLTDSLFVDNNDFGIVEYTNGDYNAFYGNGAAYGGSPTPSAGANDISTHNPIYNASTNPQGSIKYLPRGPEDGSLLATAGSGGSHIGAQVLWKIGRDGTLQGETGWDTVRSPENGYGSITDSLWPFPNEGRMKMDMGAYDGPGLAGLRGFTAAGTQLNGTDDVTLTSYIWEYLGNQMPDDIYVDITTPKSPEVTGIE